ncbi:MAG: recombinase family protein [Pseudomonadales bacterium]|nr:recombinase family protein [Pseudomonadales bacterium]
MFELSASGDYSIKKLANTMYKEGMRSPQGNKLAVSRTHSLLRDPFYMGKIRWNDEIYEGKQEPLISKEVFDKVQKLLKSKTTPTYMKHSYLFKGLIRCATCKGLITWEFHSGHRYSHCNHYNECDQETRTRQFLEEWTSYTTTNLMKKSPRSFITASLSSTQRKKTS